MANNIVDKIDTEVTVWTQDGNPMEHRRLLTLDTFGIVVTGCGGEDLAVFVPWCQVKYVDYPAENNLKNIWRDGNMGQGSGLDA